MKSARSLVEHFEKSTQAMGKLQHQQRVNLHYQGHYPEKLFQDVIHSSVVHLPNAWSTTLPPKSNRSLVFNEDITATYLTPALYDSVEDVEQLLKQMAEAQKLLEGEKYRTISLIPFFLHTIWRQYEQMSRDHTKPAAVVNRANVLQKDFENCYLTWSISGRYVGMQSRTIYHLRLILVPRIYACSFLMKNMKLHGMKSEVDDASYKISTCDGNDDNVSSASTTVDEESGRPAEG